MKRYLLSLLGITMLSAALLPAGGAVAQGDTWTGWYGGVHGGYRWVDADFSSPAYTATVGGFLFAFPARNENYDLDSAIVGLQLGYNKKHPNSNWLWGIEGDFTWGWGDDSVANSGTLNTNFPTVGTINFQQFSEVEANWQATLRARLGWVDGPWLYYATAGIAWMDVEWRDSLAAQGVLGVAGAFSFNHSDDFTVVGLALGAGVEKELNNPLWRARLEYLYEHFGDSESVRHGATNPGQIGTLEIDDAHKIRIAISRKIGQ